MVKPQYKHSSLRAESLLIMGFVMKLQSDVRSRRTLRIIRYGDSFTINIFGIYKKMRVLLTEIGSYMLHEYIVTYVDSKMSSH